MSIENMRNFGIGAATAFSIYYLGGGEFERGYPLALAITISIIIGFYSLYALRSIE